MATTDRWTEAATAPAASVQRSVLVRSSGAEPSGSRPSGTRLSGTANGPQADLSHFRPATRRRSSCSSVASEILRIPDSRFSSPLTCG